MAKVVGSFNGTKMLQYRNANKASYSRLPFAATAAFGLATLFGVVAWGFVQVVVLGRHPSGFPAAAQVTFQSHILLGLFAGVVGVILLHTGAGLWPSLSTPAGSLKACSVRTMYAGLLFAALLEGLLIVWDRFDLEQSVLWILLAAYPLTSGIYLSAADRAPEL